MGWSSYGWSCRRDSVPNGRSSVSERRVLWAELSIACACIGVTEVILTPLPHINIAFRYLFLKLFFYFVSNEYVSWFAGYKMRMMLCISVLTLCLLRCAFFHSTPGLFYINFPISNSSSFYVRLGFIILKQVRQVVLSSNLLSSVLRIVLVGNFGQVCHFHLFFWDI